MDRTTRKDLKSDKFAAEVGHTVEFLGEHRKQATAIGSVALLIIVGVAVGYYYVQQQHANRQQALRKALDTFEANVTDVSSPVLVTFSSQEEKDAAVTETFTAVASEYPGSDEAVVATIYLGLAANAKGNAEEAAKYLLEAVESGRSPYDSQAALSLSELYASQGKQEEAEKLLRNLVENPTVLVSKEQATIALARVVGERDASEARTLLEPLRTVPGAVSRAALTLLGNLPNE